MKVAHLLRKYNPAEWGGTETAVQRLLDGLRVLGVESRVFAPSLRERIESDPFASRGHLVQRYRAFLPVARISPEQRRQLVAVGGNLMSLDLPVRLAREPGLQVIHTHALNRIGAIGLNVAKLRSVPLVITIHGGALDLSAATKQALSEPMKGGVEWGKIFGLLLRSRKLLEDADAIVTCNEREAELLRKKYPRQRIVTHPHGIPAEVYQQDQSNAALEAFPQLKDRRFLLVAGRIDPVKNQRWVVEQMPEMLRRFPNAHLVLAGAATDAEYFAELKRRIETLGLTERVLLTGGLAPGSAPLIGLFQLAKAVVVPSHSETFGLVLLEAWAAGAPVICTRTSGALGLVEEDVNGRFFELDDAPGFHHVLAGVLEGSRGKAMGEAGRAKVFQRYTTKEVAVRMKCLYEELVSEKTRR